MKDIDIIKLKISQLGEKIISKEQLIKVICNVTPEDSDKIFKNLRKSNKIKYVFLNYYYILSEDEKKLKIIKYYPSEIVFGILNKLNVKWYISLEKSLELNNVVWQSYNKITIINNKISKKYRIFDTEFEFRKTKSELINNYNQNKTKNRITQNISTNEKNFIDFIYFNKPIPKELKDSVDKNKVKKILKAYKKNFQKEVKRFLE